MGLQTVIPLFPQFTALDGIGPYEVLQRIPDIDVTFIGHELGVVRSDNGMLGSPDYTAVEQKVSPAAKLDSVVTSPTSSSASTS